jgi:hypothetical protein
MSVTGTLSGLSVAANLRPALAAPCGIFVRRRFSSRGRPFARSLPISG